MKNIAFFSTDFSMCVSLLMYLQNRFHVTATTDIDVLKRLINSSEINLVILDTDPSLKIEHFCNMLKNEMNIPVILTYVYRNNLKDFDQSIRKLVSSVFYKPYDLNEVSCKLMNLVV